MENPYLKLLNAFHFPNGLVVPRQAGHRIGPGKRSLDRQHRLAYSGKWSWAPMNGYRERFRRLGLRALMKDASNIAREAGGVSPKRNP